MLSQYRDGIVPVRPQSSADQELTESRRHTLRAYQEHMNNYEFHLALTSLWSFISDCNKYVVARQPWALFKNQEKEKELNAVLYHLVQALAWITVLLSPAMPQISLAMAAQLDFRLEQALGLEGSDLVEPGRRLLKPEPLFPRVDSDKVRAKAAKAKAKAKITQPAPEISIDEFARLDLRLGTILEAEAVPGTDKLLRLLVDLGQDKPRTIVSGIAQYYNPQELPGLQVVVVANLKPVTLRGVESHGMILAASGADTVKILLPAAPLPPGSKVK
jgi:methionyl-tRNA synthetase